MAAQEHSSYFSVSGELTENAETLGKTPIGDRRRAELKILWSLAPCGFDPRPRYFIFNDLRAWSVDRAKEIRANVPSNLISRAVWTIGDIRPPRLTQDLLSDPCRHPRQRYDNLLIGRLETETERLGRISQYDFPEDLQGSVPTAPLITELEPRLAHDPASDRPRLVEVAAQGFPRIPRSVSAFAFDTQVCSPRVDGITEGYA